MGTLEPLDGMVKRHNHLRIGQYHQHLTELLDPELSPLQVRGRAALGGAGTLLALLGWGWGRCWGRWGCRLLCCRARWACIHSQRSPSPHHLHTTTNTTTTTTTTTTHPPTHPPTRST